MRGKASRAVSDAAFRVLELVAGEGATAAQIAKFLGIRVSAVRKHLEKLEKRGLVRHIFVRRGVGRPRKLYIATEDGIELLPKIYSEFLLEFLGKLFASGLGARVEEIVDEIARGIVEKSRSQDLASSIENLNRLGFMCTVRASDGEVEVISRNCPLLKVAKSYYELICVKFHTEILKSLSGGGDVHISECIAKGNLFCRHRIYRSPPT